MSARNGLPEGWTWAQLGDVASPGQKRNPKADGDGEFLYVDVEALDNSAQRIVAPKRLRNSEAPSRARVEIKGGDVLFSLVQPYLKNVARVPEELDGQIASTAYCLVRPASGVSSSYLFHFLTQESFIHALPTYGYSPPAARDEEFYAMLIPTSPTDEQRRIVAAIEEQFSRLDAGVTALERVQTNLKHYRAAVLKAAVEGRLTEAWREENPDVEPASELLERILKERRERWEKDQLAKYQKKGMKPPKNWQANYKEPAAPDTAELPELPRGWEWVTWNQVGTSQNGRAFPSKEYSSSGVKLLRPGNLHSDGSVQWTEKNTRFMPTEWSENYPSYLLGSRELVINLTAQSLADEFLGRVCLTSDGEHCLLNQRIGRLTPITLLPNYLLWMFKSHVFRRYVDGLNTGSLIQHMFVSQIAEFTFPLPPLHEQRVIAEKIEQRLSVLKRVEVTIEACFKRTVHLRQSILKRAFEGKLVPQDPTDEPASELLARIKAER